MPHSVSVCGFIGHAFINKTKFCIILDQFFLAGQHKTFSALLSCILDCTLDQLSCISVFTIIRKCMLMCDKVTHENQIDSSLLFRNNYGICQSSGVCSCPHLQNALKIGIMLFPFSDKLYSTLGGTWGYSLRIIIPSFSSSFN